MKPILILLLMTSLIHCEDVLNVAPNKHTPDVNRAIAQCETDVAKIKADAEKDILASNEKLRIVLVKGQEAATKKGDLDEALALKGMIEKLPKADQKKPVMSNAAILAQIKGKLKGNLEYAFSGGHKGRLQIDSMSVQDVGSMTGGNFSANEKDYTLLWANGTKWTIGLNSDGDLTGNSLSPNDGDTKLVPVKK